MTEQTLPDEMNLDPIPFERRQSDRWPVEGVATAFELGGDHFGQTHSMRMLDYSHEGMGAYSDTMISPGATVSVGFQSPGYPAKRGIVARCEPNGEGYRVAVVFEQRLAA